MKILILNKKLHVQFMFTRIDNGPFTEINNSKKKHKNPRLQQKQFKIDVKNYLKKIHM